MRIAVQRVDWKQVESMRERYRHEANCQIVHDSALSRGIADPYLITADGRSAGYGGVWNKYHAGRAMEFYVTSHMRPSALPLFRELLLASDASHVEAQTNMPLMLALLFDTAKDIHSEKVLFEDSFRTAWTCPGSELRAARTEEERESGQWVLEVGGGAVAAGGILYHYNPPYGDVYLEVAESERRKGFGSFLAQELKRICYENGRRPAARCDPDNVASRRTLEKAGFLTCGRLLVGEVDWSEDSYMGRSTAW